MPEYPDPVGDFIVMNGLKLLKLLKRPSHDRQMLPNSS